MSILLNHEFKLGSQKAPVFAGYDAEGNEIEGFVYRLELSTLDGRQFTHPKFGGQDLIKALSVRIRTKGEIDLNNWLELTPAELEQRKMLN